MNQFAPRKFNFPIHLSVMIFPAGERCVTSQKRLRRRLYNFNECVFVIIWPVVPLSDLFYRIISASMAIKIGRVTFFEDPGFFVLLYDQTLYERAVFRFIEI